MASMRPWKSTAPLSIAFVGILEAEKVLMTAKGRSCLDHTSLGVRNFEESLKFYDETLACLGIARKEIMDTKGYKGAGYGIDNSDFWINPAPVGTKSTNMHDHATVQCLMNTCP